MKNATPDVAPNAINSEWRRNWRVGVAVSLVIGLGYTVWPSVSSLFIDPLQKAFGWSRGQIALTYYAVLLSALIAPGVGVLVDHLGARRVLLTALALVAIGYLLLAFTSTSLSVYYGVSTLLAVAGMATSGVSNTRIINGTFSDTRGFALAITRMGLAIASALLPGLLFVIIDRWGFHAGFLTLALLVALIPLPFGWLWIPRGRDQASASTSHPQPISHLLRNPRAICVCIAAALNYAPVLTILSQLKPLAIEKGLADGAAVMTVSVLGIASFSGCLVSGLLVDRVWAPGVATLLNVVGAIGCLCLRPEAPGPGLFFAGVALVGFGQGAEIDVVAYIIARWFGLNSYGTLYGLTTLTIGVCASVGAMLIGIAHDRYGNYQMALGSCVVSFLLAAILYASLGRAPRDA